MAELLDAMQWRGEVRALVFEGEIPPADLLAALDEGAHRDRLVSDVTTPNMVSNAGRQQMTKLICGETASLGNYIGLTTSLTTPSLVATTLTDEISRKVCSITASYLTYYQRKVAYFSPTDFTSTGIAGEGIFDTASTGGTMWAINSITVSKSSTQSLVVSHLIQATS